MLPGNAMVPPGLVNTIFFVNNYFVLSRLHLISGHFIIDKKGKGRQEGVKENILTAAEAAEILKVKKNTVYDMIKRGDLRASKLGKQLRIRQSDLDAYIQYGSSEYGKKIPLAGDEKRISGKKGRKEKVGCEEPFASKEASAYEVMPQRSAEIMIICGQDMVLDLLADRLSRHPQGCGCLRSYKGSYNALYAMYQGSVDVATCHLWHGASDSYNLPYISSMLPGTDVVVIHLLKRKQGFYVPKGNPKNICTVKDLKRSDVTIANREPGSGTRVLLDEKLRQYEIETSQIQGYDHIVNSHLEAAAAVSGKEADVALGNEKHSLQVPDIDFVFLQEESYDMVFRKEEMQKPAYKTLLSILRSEEYKKEVESLGNYDVTDMGKQIYSD